MNPSEYPRYDDVLPREELAEPAVQPAVIVWYKAYCVLMALVFIAGAAAGAALVMYHPQLPRESFGKMSPAEISLRGVVLVVFCVLLFAANIAALFLPRRPWAWVYHLVNISLGLAPCCIFTLPLFLVWLKPQLQEYYGYKPAKLDTP
jgi:hypothetical protein